MIFEVLQEYDVLYDSLPQIFRPVQSKLKTSNLKHLFPVRGVQVGLARDEA
jgi:hypothetical protein